LAGTSTCFETVQGPLGGAATAANDRNTALETAPKSAMVIARLDAPCIAFAPLAPGYAAAEKAVKGADTAIDIIEELRWFQEISRPGQPGFPFHNVEDGAGELPMPGDRAQSQRASRRPSEEKHRER
jgi:hypothetical protein